MLNLVINQEMYIKEHIV